MSTQTIKERPLVTGLKRAGSLNWTSGPRLVEQKFMGQKKVAIAGVAAVAVVALAAIYFWGNRNAQRPIHERES